MILFLSAQDLRSVLIGLIDGSEFVRLKEQETTPEGYLKTLNDFLVDKRISDLKGVCLVTGPGSFTSNRIILTIANTLHFVHNLPLYTLENPDHLPPKELICQKGIGNALNLKEFAHVAYDRPPHITQSRGDKSLDSGI